MQDDFLLVMLRGAIGGLIAVAPSIWRLRHSEQILTTAPRDVTNNESAVLAWRLTPIGVAPLSIQALALVLCWICLTWPDAGTRTLSPLAVALSLLPLVLAVLTVDILIARMAHIPRDSAVNWAVVVGCAAIPLALVLLTCAAYPFQASLIGPFGTALLPAASFAEWVGRSLTSVGAGYVFRDRGIVPLSVVLYAPLLLALWHFKHDLIFWRSGNVTFEVLTASWPHLRTLKGLLAYRSRRFTPSRVTQETRRHVMPLVLFAAGFGTLVALVLRRHPIMDGLWTLEHWALLLLVPLWLCLRWIWWYFRWTIHEDSKSSFSLETYGLWALFHLAFLADLVILLRAIP